MKIKYYYFTPIFLICLLPLCKCERLHEQIYSSIEGGAACFRRLNGTHQAGCTSSNKGAVGVIHIIKDISDVQWMVYNSSAGPYMAVVSTHLFNSVIELLMSNPENVAGVLLFDNATMRADSFSQESKCPNEYASSAGAQCSSSDVGGVVWNGGGTGLLRRDIPFPIFYLPQARSEEIVKIEDCHNRFNLDRDNHNGMPLCSLQLNSFMFAAVNSVVCMRRSATPGLFQSSKVCDPLGDQNVFYSLFPLVKETTKKQVTLVTARIDTASLFDGLAPGAASSVVGMVALIIAADALAKMIPVSDANLYSRNVLFTLLNGEAFDYIGSQRVAYDIANGTTWPPTAPLTPRDIALHVELGQIGGALSSHNDSTWPLHAFGSSAAAAAPKINEFINDFSINIGSAVPVDFTDNLPPSSLHSFRRILKNVTTSGELPEVLIVDHDKTFTNMYYHSALDDHDKIGYVYHNISIGNNGSFVPTEELIANGTMKEAEPQVKISRLATALAKTLYKDVVGTQYTGNISASAHLVDEMLYCFLRSQACRPLLAADYGGSTEERPAERVPPLYVGVAAWQSVPAVFAGHLIALLTGTHLPNNRTNCDARANPNFTNYWLKGWNHSGVCIQTTMNFSVAVSPAFVIPDYDLTTGEYSSWTESVWQAMWARVFVAAGGGSARAAAIAGAFATVIAALLTYWLQRNAHLIFANPPSTIVRSDATTGILRTVNC